MCEKTSKLKSLYHPKNSNKIPFEPWLKTQYYWPLSHGSNPTKSLEILGIEKWMSSLQNLFITNKSKKKVLISMTARIELST